MAQAAMAERRAARAAIRGSRTESRDLASIGRGTLAVGQGLDSALWITCRGPRTTGVCDFRPGDVQHLITLWKVTRPDDVVQLQKLAGSSAVFCMSKINIQETYTPPVRTRSRTLAAEIYATLGVDYCEKIEPRGAVRGSRYV
jgi:hypothetical protein